MLGACDLLRESPQGKGGEGGGQGRCGAKQEGFQLESSISLIPGELWGMNWITELVSP